MEIRKIRNYMAHLHIASFHQQKRINKSLAETFYLLEQSNSGSETAVWKIAGSTNNVYTVKLFLKLSLETGDVYCFECDCPDGQIHTRKFNCVCKHVCFILLKVLKYPLRDYNTSNIFNLQVFFSKLYMGTSHMQEIVSRMQNCQIDIEDNLVCQFRQLQMEEKTNTIRPEECPICFEANGPDIVTCFTCKNSVHLICMNRWSSIKKTKSCVFCRASFLSFPRLKV